MKSRFYASLILACVGCAGDEETPRSIEQRDLDYLKRRFFFVCDPVDPLLSGRLVPPESPDWVPPPTISNLKVWHDERVFEPDYDTFAGYAFLDPTAHGAPDSIGGMFRLLLENEDYVLRDDLFAFDLQPPLDKPHLYRYPVVELPSPLGANQILAATFMATYQTPEGEQKVEYGSIEPRLRAKVLHLPESIYQIEYDTYDRSDPWYAVHRLELRSIYSLGAGNIKPEELQASVERIDSGVSSFPGAGPDATYLRALGVDKEGYPHVGFDHRIDGRCVDYIRGMVILPDLNPFAPTAEDSVWPPFRADILAVPSGRPAYFVGEHAIAVYDKPSHSVVRGQDDKYLISIVVP